MLIAHRFPIEDSAEAFRVAQDKSQGVFRVIPEFGQEVLVHLQRSSA
jgi:hypothetical protein